MTDRQKRRAEARKQAKKLNRTAESVSQEGSQVSPPVSPAQQAANQANAQLSTGPTSAEGIAISSHNNFRHGLTQTEGDLILLEGESKEEYSKRFAEFEKEWNPTTATEHDLVERLVSRQWLRRRAMKLQTLFLARDGRITDEKQYALYRRYETQHERAFNKALADLMRLRSLRLREQNGFESQRRQDELHAYKIQAMKDREYRNKLVIQEKEARLLLAEARLSAAGLTNPAPFTPETEEISLEANQ